VKSSGKSAAASGWCYDPYWGWYWCGY
jgi:hypothetical protein